MSTTTQAVADVAVGATVEYRRHGGASVTQFGVITRFVPEHGSVELRKPDGGAVVVHTSNVLRTVTPIIVKCEGCDQEFLPEDVEVYDVLYDTPQPAPVPEKVIYCADCAKLAEINWTGDIASCTPCTKVAS